MKSSLLAWIALLGLGGATAWQIHRNGALQDRLHDVEAQLAAREAEPLPAAKGAPSLETGAVPRRLDGLQRQFRQLKQDVERVATAVAKQPANVDAPSGKAEPLEDRPQFRDAVRSIVLDLTDDIVFRQKLGGQVGRKDLGKHAPFATLADTLKLDATQEDKFRTDLVTLKEDVMLVLTQERDDGKDIMAEIQKAESFGESDPKRTAIFMQLFKLKVPGTEESYWDRVVKLQAAFRKRTDDYLRTEQVEIFNAIKVDLLSVEVN